MGVAHLALELGLGHKCRHRVDHHHIDSTGAHQRVGNLQRLFARIRLGDDQVIDVDAQLLRVCRVERMFGIDEGTCATLLLGFRNDMQRQGGLARTFRAVDLDHASLRQAANPERHVETEGACRDRGDVHRLPLAEAHHRALAKGAFDLAQGRIKGLGFV